MKKQILSTRKTSAALAIIAAIGLTGCAQTTDAENSEPVPSVDDTNQEQTPQEAPFDKTEGVSNDPALSDRLYKMAESTCAAAKSEGSVAVTELLDARTVFIPEEDQIAGFTGFATSLTDEDAGAVLIRGSKEFAECSMYVIANNSIEAYGEPFGHVQLTEAEDYVTFDFLFTNYKENVAHTVDAENVVVKLERVDEDGVAQIATDFSRGVTKEDMDTYEQLLNGSN